MFLGADRDCRVGGVLDHGLVVRGGDVLLRRIGGLLWSGRALVFLSPTGGAADRRWRLLHYAQSFGGQFHELGLFDFGIESI